METKNIESLFSGTLSTKGEQWVKLDEVRAIFSECRHCGFYVALKIPAADVSAIAHPPVATAHALTDAEICALAQKYQMSRAALHCIAEDIASHLARKG